jgi:hypothetical protein
VSTSYSFILLFIKYQGLIPVIGIQVEESYIKSLSWDRIFFAWCISSGAHRVRNSQLFRVTKG